MGLFTRKKQTTAETHADPWTAMQTPIRLEGAMLLEMLDVEGQQQPFKLRDWVNAMFVADFLSSIHVLRAAHVTPDQWWDDANLPHQYDNGDRATREEALRTAMQFGNTLDASEYDDSRPLVLHATLRLKALALAFACDVEYGTSFSRQIASDPASFGTKRFGDQ